MWTDPIVEEIHAVRKQIAQECDYDLKRIVQSLRSKEGRDPQRVVHKADLKRRDATEASPRMDRKDAA
jgi:hypothetical protein